MVYIRVVYFTLFFIGTTEVTIHSVKSTILFFYNNLIICEFESQTFTAGVIIFSSSIWIFL